MARDSWQKLLPVIVTKLNNKFLTIPAFGTRCGENEQCLSMAGIHASVSQSQVNLGSNFTVELWNKHIKAGVAGIIWTVADAISGHSIKLYMSYTTNQYKIDIVNTSGAITLVFPNPLLTNNWTHYAVVCDNVTGTLSLYINGILQVPIAGIFAGTFTFANTTTSIGAVGVFKFNEYRLWNVARSAEKINNFMFAPRDTTGVIDVGLKAYWKFKDVIGSLNALDSITANVMILGSGASSNSFFDPSDNFPLKYGSSFVSLIASVTGLTQNCSLIFPVFSPAAANHSLYVTWTDFDGVFQRRRLYDNGSDIAPTYPVYNGEPLPTSFNFEFWNIDGQPTVSLANDLTINISQTTQPAHGLDHNQVTAAIPVSSVLLAAQFPWVFPVVFNQHQSFP